MYPFDTITVFSPYSFAAWQMSITYSPQIVGSLYVNAIEGHPLRIARSTTSSGGMYDEFTWSDRDFEMSQFWQKKQPMLHPAVPIENTRVPGRKWFSGFFSMGSICNAAGCAYPRL